MKFAIRDDDLNYFYSPDFIEENIGGLWDICPFSMSVIPYVMGSWMSNKDVVESYPPGKLPGTVLQDLMVDNKIYDVSNNAQLVEYIRRKIRDGKVYITFHAIHHRNLDLIMPQIRKNYGFGAEFYTSRDLTNEVKKAIGHIEEVFDQKVSVFTPPQNIYSQKGFEAITNSGMNICARPLQKLDQFLWYAKKYGPITFLDVLYKKIIRRSQPYDKLIECDGIRIADHRTLQPGTDMTQLYRDFDYACKKSDHFILSTHSYAFKYKMHTSNQSMGEALRDFMNYAKTNSALEFVTLDKIFS